MKTKLITYHFSDNYGALFQAYGLREWFRRRGIEAEFINYHPRYVEEGGCFDQLLNPRRWKKNLTIGYMRLSYAYWSVFGNSEQRREFARFRREYLGVRGARIVEAVDLDVRDADLLVCGSDQIWNPSVQKGLDPVYFLDFCGGDNARRISYAPSFGRAELPPEFIEQVGWFLSRLDKISVREKSGVDIVRAVSGREAICVPDPTILLGDFCELLSGDAPLDEKYVFCYALRTDEVIREVAGHVAKLEKAKLISPISARQRWRPIGTSIAPGPVKWLKLLDSASTVVTNSFHGVALSIVQNKEFLAVAMPGKRMALNERVRSLLAECGLLCRIVSGMQETEIEKVLKQPINWVVVNSHVAAMRRRGDDFLMKEIGAVNRNTHV